MFRLLIEFRTWFCYIPPYVSAQTDCPLVFSDFEKMLAIRLESVGCSSWYLGILMCLGVMWVCNIEEQQLKGCCCIVGRKMGYGGHT